MPLLQILHLESISRLGSSLLLLLIFWATLRTLGIDHAKERLGLAIERRSSLSTNQSKLITALATRCGSHPRDEGCKAEESVWFLGLASYYTRTLISRIIARPTTLCGCGEHAWIQAPSQKLGGICQMGLMCWLQGFLSQL